MDRPAISNYRPKKIGQSKLLIVTLKRKRSKNVLVECKSKILSILYQPEIFLIKKLCNKCSL